MPPNRQNVPILFDATGVPLTPGRSRSSGGRVSVTDTIGAPGFAAYSGYITTFDDRFDDGTRDALYRSYQQMIRDTAIVAAGINLFMSIVAKEKWFFEPAEADTDGQFAELAEQILFQGDTSWYQIVRRASLYRFFGFTVHEWIARRGTSDVPEESADQDLITVADLESRPYRTIERWDTDPHGRVRGIIQRSPQHQGDIYLPVAKTLYLADKALSDAPHGFGLMRSMVAPARQLTVYEQLEAIGFEGDLRGIPIIRYPKREIEQEIGTGISEEGSEEGSLKKVLKPLEAFLQAHGKTSSSGLILDSSTYETLDDAGRPTNIRRWDVEVMRGGATGLNENNMAIARKNRELARIMGVEGLLLGDVSGSGSGGYTLSKDKTHIFFLLVDGTLLYMSDSVRRQLLRPFWRLNGFPPEMMPTPKTEAVRYADVEEVAAVVRDMAAAGATLFPADPAINEIRAMVGLSPQPERPIEVMTDMDDPNPNDDPEDLDDEPVEPDDTE